MKRKIVQKAAVYLFILALTLLVAACAPQADEQETVTLTDEVPKTEQAPSEPLPEPEVIESYAEEVQELLDKSQEVSSYHYSYTAQRRNMGGSYEDLEGYQARLKSDRIRKTYFSPQKLSKEEFYNEVYLETAAQSAVAVCSTVGVLCEGQYKKSYTISYQEEALKTTPLDLMQNVPPSAEKVGEEVIESRRAAILEYETGQGNVERLYVDAYSGLPLRQEVYNIVGDERVLLRKDVFSLKSLNNIKNSEVELPDDYQLVR